MTDQLRNCPPTKDNTNALRVIFGICFVVGVGFRIYSLDQIPGMHTDEAAYGLWAREIHFGNFYPLMEETVAKSGPLFMYLIAFSYKLFGMDLFAVRFVGAFFSILTILTVYLLAKNLFNEKVGLLSGSLTAVSGFFVTHSRMAYDVDLVPFFLTSSLLFCVLSSIKRQTLYLSVAGLLLGLGLHLHPTAYIGIPVVLCLVWILYQKSIFRKPGFYIAVALFLLAISPIFVFNVQNDFPTLDSMTAESTETTQTIGPLLQDMAVGFQDIGDCLSEQAVNYWCWGGWQYGHKLNFVLPVDFALLIIGILFATIIRKKTELFLLFWLFISLSMLVLFTDSGEGWGIDLRLFPERLNVVFPVVIILVGFSLSKIFDLTSRFHHSKTILLLFFICILSYHSATIVNDYFGWYKQTDGAGRYTMDKDQVADYVVDNFSKSSILISDDFINFGPRSLKFLTNGSFVIMTSPPEGLFYTSEYSNYINKVNSLYGNRDRVFVFVANRLGEKEIVPFSHAIFKSLYPSLEPHQIFTRSNGEPAYYIYVLEADVNSVAHYEMPNEIHLANQKSHLVISDTSIRKYTPDVYDHDDKEGYTWLNCQIVWYKNYEKTKQYETILRFDTSINMEDIVLMASKRDLKKISIPLNQYKSIVISMTPETVQLEEGSIQTKTKALYVGNEEMLSNTLNNNGFDVDVLDHIPMDMNPYDLVVISDYGSCYITTADYLKDYINNGGNVILLSGVPSFFPYNYIPHSTSEGFNDISSISDWFGASFYGNVGLPAIARVSVGSYSASSFPNGFSIYSSDSSCEALVGNLNIDKTQVLAMWDVPDTNGVFAFIHSYGSGKLYYQAAISSDLYAPSLEFLAEVAVILTSTSN